MPDCMFGVGMLRDLVFCGCEYWAWGLRVGDASKVVVDLSLSLGRWKQRIQSRVEKWLTKQRWGPSTDKTALELI
jgi:hypothetical protein